MSVSHPYPSFSSHSAFDPLRTLALCSLLASSGHLN